ncbi:MAG TPA: cyanophycin synthetase, partial [Chitinophagaceae bacterium]|nr:cyanophycin synthetase [Chitinophagaceae bacterium]
LTAMDPDHLDIYGTEEVMEEAFIEFTARVRRDGWLISKKGLRREKNFKADQTLSYSLEDHNADIHGKDIRLTPEGYHFNVVEGPWDLGGVTLQLGGLHNVENAVAAVGVAHRLGIRCEEIREAVAGFRGVKRRFEFILRDQERVYIDDYAHHPEELKALILGARQLFPGMPCTVIFQPHLFTRTRDLALGFAQSLELADRTILLPVYPAREKPIEGVNSGMIASLMQSGSVELMGQQACMEWLRTHPVQLLITCGAGDVDQLVDPIRIILQNQKS